MSKLKRVHLISVFIIVVVLVGFLLKVERKKVGLEIVRPWSISARLEYWGKALNVFSKSPLIGTGIGTYSMATRNISIKPEIWSQYAHNFFLHNLAEIGFFGALAFLFLIFYIVKFSYKSARNYNKNPEILGCFGALLNSFLYSLVDFDWHFPAIFLTFLILFLSLLGNKEKFARIR